MDFNVVTMFAAVVAGGATLWTAIILHIELRLLTRHAQTSFEDDLSREYREIVASLPVLAFYVDGRTDGSPSMEEMRVFYRYFDLSNQQLFLGEKKRVSRAVLEDWKEGIAGNMRLPLFAAAWQELVEHLPEDFFKELRDLGGDSGKPRPS